MLFGAHLLAIAPFNPVPPAAEGIAAAMLIARAWPFGGGGAEPEEMDLRVGLGAFGTRAFTFAMMDCASGPSYGRIMTGLKEVGEERMAGGARRVWRYARLAVQ